MNDLPVGRNVDETLRLVKAFQYTDVHGEVCPANWTPGAKTMKPDPVKSQVGGQSHQGMVTRHEYVRRGSAKLFEVKRCSPLLAMCTPLVHDLASDVMEREA